MSSKSRPGSSKRLFRAIRELIAVAFMVFVITKVFFFDIDYWLLSHYAPHLRWIVDFRFLWFVLFLAAVVLLASRLQALGLVFYVIFYPFVLIFWRLPRLLLRLKSWTLALALFAGVVSLARSLKFTVLIAASLIMGTVLALVPRPHTLIAFGGALLLISVVGVYGKTIAGSFKSTLDFFSSNVLAKVWGFAERSFGVDEEVRSLPVESRTEAQAQAWTNALGMSVLCNRGCHFLASKLQDLRRRRLLAVIYMSKVLVLFCLSLYVFSLVNFALYRIAPGSFRTLGPPGVFGFVWYTFHALYGNGIAEIAPASHVAQALSMVTTTFAVLILLVVIVFFVTTVQAERDDERMTQIVEDIKRQARDLDGYLGSEFGMTIQQAVDLLRHSKTGVLGAVYLFSPELRPNEAAAPLTNLTPPTASAPE